MSENRNPVSWFEIYVQDMARARAFYEATFEVTLQPLSGSNLDVEMWAFPVQMGSPGCTGALVKMEGKDAGGGGTLIYFSSDDCAVVAARAAEFGGQVQREKFAIGQYGFVAYILDTEGNLIGLHSM